MTRIQSVFNLLKRLGFALLMLGWGTEPIYAAWQRIHTFDYWETSIVKFQDENRGWAGEISLHAVTFYKSQNGGYDWEPVAGFPEQAIIADIAFWGDRHIAVAADYLVIVSNDSGQSWTEVDLPDDGTAMNIAYGDSNVIVTVGTYIPGPPIRREIHRSLDGGETWTRVYYFDDPNGFYNHHVGYSSSGTFLVGTTTSGILRSTDQGGSWELIGDHDPETFPVQGVQEIKSPAPSVFFVAGSNSGIPIIARSLDDGLTWAIVWEDTTTLYYSIWDLSFADSLHGWAGGERGLLVETTDGGNTWHKSVLDSITGGLDNLSFVSTTTGFAFDGSGPGSLWRWDTTTNARALPELPNSLEISVYPNPFNSTLSILLDVPLQQEVTITLYDLLGREVDVIHRGRLDNSTLSYTAPPTLASGIYFLRAATTSQTQMQKVVLLK